MNLAEFIHETNYAQDSDALLNRFRDFLSFLGISRFVIFDLSYDFALLNDIKVDILISYPEEKTNYYLVSQKFDLNSVYERTLVATAPFLWEEVKRNNDSRILLRVIEDYEETKFCTGIGVTIHRPMGKIIGVAFFGFTKEIMFNKDIISLLHAASHQFYLAYTDFKNEISEKKCSLLTERECEVLKCIAYGKTKSETAEILSVSESAIKRHCENIFIKLNVKNLPAAVARAIKSGLIAYFWIVKLII